MSKKKSETATKPSSVYKIGDRTVADTVWDGNKYVTQYKPTDGETQSMNYLQSAIPTAYQDALSGGNAQQYAQNWYNSQLNQLNQNLNPQLTALKDNLITGGQVGSNIGWNKINALSDSYTDAISDLSVNKDLMAQNYRNNLLSWADSLQNSMNNYYNLGNTVTQNSTANQQAAANQGLQYTQYNNSLNSGTDWLSTLGGLAGSIIGSTVGPMGASFGSTVGQNLGNQLSKKSG